MARTEPYLEEIEDDEMADAKVGNATVTQDGDDIVVDLEGREPEYEPKDTSKHDANLAKNMSEDDRIALGLDLVEQVEADEEARKEWRVRLKEGMEIIGLKDIPTEASAFDGAATVNHPGIAEAMVRFNANALEEVFPAEGPVKTKVVGKQTPERIGQSNRVSEFMNYQLTEADDEYFEHTDNMLMYLPFSGSAFKKVFYDTYEEQTLSRFITAERFIVPYDATSLKTAPRYTYWYTITRGELLARMASGEFLESTAIDEDGSQNTGKNDGSIREMEDESDKREQSRADDDATYEIYEIHCELVQDFDKHDGSEGFEVPLPYVVTVEKESGEILAIRRLWREGDPKRKKRVHFIHYKFLPGLGFYGWGYLHIIGSLGKAASGALRALLDGAASASLQGGFKSKESKVAGEFIFTPGVWKDIDMTAEDLAKSFYTPPFKEPSPALFKTLELLTMGIKEFSTTTEAMTGAGDNKGPVGTTLALIEQGSKIYSSIHKRLHKSARFEFKLIAELNYEHMPDEYPYDVEGGRSVLRSDFDRRVDILPVSDPNIYSNVQRTAQAQGTLELIGSDPTLYDDEARREAHLDMHKALRTPDPERFLPKRVVRRVDPVTENQALLTGGAAKAFVEQDHASHIQAHMMFQQEVQGMGLEQEAVEAFMISMQAHIAEHHAHAYRLRVEQEIGVPLPDTDFTDSRDDEDMPIQIDNAVARAVASKVAPPPPPQGPMDEQAMREEEHQQRLRHRDEEHQQEMNHRQQEHGLSMDIKDETAEQDLTSKAKKDEQDFRKKQADNLLDTAAKADNLGDQGGGKASGSKGR